MKKILQNLKENWITYGFETLVVIVGILGAFALNNWNEERLARKQQVITLKDLQSDLSKNQIALSEAIELHKSQVVSQRTLLQILNGRDRTLTSDSLNNMVAYGLMYVGVYRPNETVIRSIVSSGNLSNIASDSIKFLLTDWDAEMEDYKHMSAIIAKLVEDHIKPFLFETYPIRNMRIYEELENDYPPLQDSRLGIEFDKMYNNLPFENMVDLRRIDTQGQANKLQDLKALEQRILALIDVELQRLQ